jgi:ABC-type transport system involved in multi-copper enzyme maturation permease subunit
MQYTFGNGLAFFFLILTIISLCAALIFIVIGLIKKARKLPAKISLLTSIILFLTSVISIIILLFTITKVTNMEEEYQAIQAQKKKEADYLIAAASFYNDI